MSLVIRVAFMRCWNQPGVAREVTRLDVLIASPVLVRRSSG